MSSPPQNNNIIRQIILDDVFTTMSSPVQDTVKDTGGSVSELAPDGSSPKRVQGSEGDVKGNSTAVPRSDEKSPQTPSTPEVTPSEPTTADRTLVDQKAYNKFRNHMKFGTPPPFDPTVPLSHRPLHRQFPYDIPVNWREEEDDEEAVAEDEAATRQTHRNFRAERQAAQARRDEKRKARQLAKSNDTSDNTLESKDNETTAPASN